MRSFSIWSAIGKPRCGIEFDNMKSDKLRYKLAIKNKERLSTNSFTDSLSDALSMKDMDSWRSKFSKSQLPGVIDGCCNEAEIANRFAEVFEVVCVPNSKEKMSRCALFLMNGFRVIRVHVPLLVSLLLI